MTIDNRIFSFPIRVYWEDTDAGGVVYHANYVRFFERARSEWLRSLGIGQQRLREDHDIVFAIRAMRLDFHAPARLDDALSATVDTVEAGRASLAFRQSLLRDADGKCLVDADVRAACLTAATFRPRPIPRELLSADALATFRAATQDSPARSSE